MIARTGLYVGVFWIVAGLVVVSLVLYFGLRLLNS